MCLLEINMCLYSSINVTKGSIMVLRHLLATASLRPASEPDWSRSGLPQSQGTADHWWRWVHRIPSTYSEKSVPVLDATLPSEAVECTRAMGHLMHSWVLREVEEQSDICWSIQTECGNGQSQFILSPFEQLRVLEPQVTCGDTWSSSSWTLRHSPLYPLAFLAQIGGAYLVHFLSR